MAMNQPPGVRSGTCRDPRSRYRNRYVPAGETVTRHIRIPAGILLLLLLLLPALAATTGPSIIGVKPVTVTPTGIPPKIIQMVVTTTPQPLGTLILTSVPSGASAYVDGSLKGTTPVTVNYLTHGSHSVVFKKNGYEDYTTTGTVTALSVAKMTAIMVPVTAAPAAPAVVPAPAGVTITTTQTVTTTVTGTSATPAVSRTTVTFASVRTVQQDTAVPSGKCTRHAYGTGEVVAAADGRLNCTTVISTNDGIGTLTLAEGTRVMAGGGGTVPAISIVPAGAGDMPADTGPDRRRWTGRAFRFLPPGTTFDPPAVVMFTLGPDEWERSDPVNLTLLIMDENSGSLEALPSTIDPAAKTISAPAGHFSVIGLYSFIPSANPGTGGQSVLDLIRTAVGPRPASLPLSPLLPDAYAPVAAVAAGIVLSAAAVTSGGSALLAGLWERVFGLLRGFLTSETAGLLNATEIEKRSLRPGENVAAAVFFLSSREILVVMLTTLGFAAAFILQDRLEVHLATLIIFLCMGGIATVLHDLAHRYSAYRAGCITEYQFWTLGTATMLVTAWLFGNAFAKPSRTLVRSETPLSSRNAAIIRLSGPAVSAVLAVLSLFLIPLGGLFVAAGSAGFTMNLLNAVFSLVPVRPNDGVEVFAWNRAAWALVFLPLIAFYLYVYTLL